MQLCSRNIGRLSVKCCLAAIAIFAVSCRGRGDVDRPFFLRNLPDSLVHYLTSPDDSALLRHIRSLGFFEAREHFKPFKDNVAAQGVGGYRRHKDEILPIFKRYAEALDREYEYAAGLHDYHLYASLSPEEVVSLAELRIRHRAFLEEPRIPASTQARRSREFLAEFERRGDLCSIGRCHMHLADLANMMERGSEEELACRRKALRAFQGSGESFMACQIMGEIASIHRGAMRTDSMRYYLDETFRLASRSRIPDQAARVLMFYAKFYEGFGRLGLAHELYGRAIEICRDYKGADHQIRSVAASMKFHADIACWDVVALLAQREQALEKLYPASKIDTVFRLAARSQIARLHMARGNTAHAERLYRRLDASIRQTRFDRQLRPPLLADWGEGLIENGRPRRAVPVLRKSIELAAARSYEVFVPRCEILLARAYLDLGNAENAESHLRRFETAARSIKSDTLNNYLARDILAARLTWIGASRAVRERTLSCALARFVASIGRLDPSPHSYLWICRAEEYRAMLHDIAGDDAALGYAAELFWHDLGRLIGTSREADAARGDAPRGAAETADALASGDLSGYLRARADSAREVVSAAGATHCLYRVANEKIDRWSVSSRGIFRETLRCPRETLERLALETRRDLAPGLDRAADARRRIPTAQLRRLARLLLPEDILSGTSARETRLLLVTADGSLGAVPFEALDAGDGDDYEPLLQRLDVAYVRRMERRADADSGPGVILSFAGNGGLRGSGGGGPRIAAAETEGRFIAHLDPGAHFAEDATATKAWLTARWQKASYLYIASHALTRPDAPYLMLIPLARAKGDGAMESSILDFSDARAADLSRCRLVVLSGCSTGAPYVDTRIVGPAFGDAFLDAGAGAVVETFWDVSDEDAAAIMMDFSRGWKSEGEAPVAALCAARRAAMRGPEGIRHPASWAAYAIRLGAMGAAGLHRE